MRIKKNIGVLLAGTLLLPASALCAQEKADTMGPHPEEVKVSLEVLTQLKNDRKTLGLTKDSLSGMRMELSDARRRIDTLQAEVRKYSQDQRRLQKDLNDMKVRSVAADKHLIDMAANFLFIPYEQYSIDKIAIPAFELVQDQSLKQEYADRFELLKSYRQDLQEVVGFLKHQGNVRNKISAGSSLDKLRTLSAYGNYHKYAWLEGAYLYSKISDIEKKLKEVVDTGHTSDFSGILGELERCVRTIQKQKQ